MLFVTSHTSPAPSSHVVTIDKTASVQRTYHKVNPPSTSGGATSPVTGVHSCCYAPHNAALIVAHDRKAVFAFSLGSHQPISRSFTPEQISSLCVSQCGLFLIGGGETGTVYVWALTTGELLAMIAKKHQSAIVQISTAPCVLGGLFATASEDSTCRVWSLTACTHQASSSSGGGGAGSASLFSSTTDAQGDDNNNNSGSGGGGGGAGSSRNACLATISAHTLSINAVQFFSHTCSGARDWVVTGSSDRTCRVHALFFGSKSSADMSSMKAIELYVVTLERPVFSLAVMTSGGCGGAVGQQRTSLGFLAGASEGYIYGVELESDQEEEDINKAMKGELELEFADEDATRASPQLDAFSSDSRASVFTLPPFEGGHRGPVCALFFLVASASHAQSFVPSAAAARQSSSTPIASPFDVLKEATRYQRDKLISASIDGKILEWDVQLRQYLRVIEDNGAYGICQLCAVGELQRDPLCVPPIFFSSATFNLRSERQHSSNTILRTGESMPILAKFVSQDGYQLPSLEQFSPAGSRALGQAQQAQRPNTAYNKKLQKRLRQEADEGRARERKEQQQLESLRKKVAEAEKQNSDILAETSALVVELEKRANP